MRIHHERIAGIDRYIERHNAEDLRDRLPDFDRLLRYIRRCRPVDSGTRILEIGSGSGWFPMLCMSKGLQCVGMDVSPHLIEAAKELGRRNGLVPDIILGNVEDAASLGEQKYDVIVASSIFEHVENWRPALANVYRALRPGGALFFESTNKFMLSAWSGEYHFPLYGWLPDIARYALRKAVQGPDVMKLGIDFNQFRYPLLRRAFRRVGFREIVDIVDLIGDDPQSGLKRRLLALARAFPPLRWLLLTFVVEATTFVCVK